MQLQFLHVQILITMGVYYIKYTGIILKKRLINI